MGPCSLGNLTSVSPNGPLALGDLQARSFRAEKLTTPPVDVTAILWVLATDRHHLTGHERGVVTGQKHDDVGHLPHLGPSPEDLLFGELGQLLVRYHLVEERVDSQARRDRVDSVSYTHLRAH